MANTIQIKRSLLSAAPATLAEGEMAYVFGTDTMYIGAPGNTIRTIAGYSHFEALVNKAISFTTVNDTKYPTVKAVVDYVASQLAGAGAGDMTKAVYDTTNNGIVDNAEKLGGVVAANYALKTYVDTAVSNLVNASPAALDTLNELATALGNDPAFATTMTTNLAGKLAKASNLSDLANVATARTNLGLGTMAQQNAASVAITGGTIDGVTLSGGTF